MDILDSNYKDHSEGGVDFPVLDPVTKEAFTDESGEVFALKLRALSSKPVQAADKEFRRLHPARTWSEEEQKAYTLAMVKAALVSWKGTRAKFDSENISKILSLWDGKLAEKAFRFILDGDRFLSA
jgi:hypothetical protein